MSGLTQVLVVEDSPTQLAQLRFTLEVAGFDVLTAADGAEALDVVLAHPVDLVISDVVMPDIDGFELCERIRRNGRLSTLPVILLTAMADPMDVLRALEAGADGFVRKPYNPEQLIARVKAVLDTAARRSATPEEAGVTVRLGGRDHYLSQERLQFLDVLSPASVDGLPLLPLLPEAPERHAQGARVLIAEDSPTELAKLRFVLEESGVLVTSAPNGRAAMAVLEAAHESEPFDIILTDVVMPELNGHAFCRAIRADPRFARIPVIMVSSLAGPNDIAAAMEAGATNFIAKPFDEGYLAARVRSLFAGRAGRLSRPAAAPINLAYGGRNFSITADRMQMLDLLVASYDHTVGQNSELRQVRDQLQELNQDLESRVAARTRELSLEIEEHARADARRTEVEAQLHASQRAEGIGALAGGVAHDFNNLLSVIIGYTEMVLDRLPEADPSRADLDEAIYAAERAAALTAQLLAFSRKQLLQPVPLNLNDATGSATGMLRRIVGEDVRLDERLAPDLGLVMADPTQIQQVIVNIVGNARDAMPAGGRLSLRIAVVEMPVPLGSEPGQARAGRFVCLTVSDTGCGIAPENLDRIFEPFFTTKEIGKGTGLGLATVYGIVKQHGGWIEVESQVGQGATFRVYLPETPGATKPAEAAPAKIHMRGGTETILVVEDEQPVRELACGLLQAQGYRILAAESGVRALEVWRTHRSEIALLLTDLVMPDCLSGRELVEQIWAEAPALKVIFTSGYSADVAGEDWILQRGLNYLQKPYRPRQLVQAVRDCLDASELTPVV